MAQVLVRTANDFWIYATPAGVDEPSEIIAHVASTNEFVCSSPQGDLMVLIPKTSIIFMTLVSLAQYQAILAARGG